MKYEVLFGIDCGVSQGFGVKYPDYIEKREEIEDITPEGAMKKAIERALYHSREYLSNPETGKTIVSVKEISDKDGNVLDQKMLLPEFSREIVSEDGFSFVECSMLEHLATWIK